jgi:hypothetical protein
VASIHTVFARGATLDEPLEIEVDQMATGRTFASAAVTIRQGERLCTRSLVLLSAPDPDLIRHQDAAPPVAEFVQAHLAGERFLPPGGGEEQGLDGALAALQARRDGAQPRHAGLGCVERLVEQIEQRFAAEEPHAFGVGPHDAAAVAVP